MTETLNGPPPAPPPDAQRLVRDPDDKVVAGVCAAFGRYTDTDPVLWRVTIAVLAFFGGAGLALYVLGWLLVPEVGQPRSLAERTLRRRDNGVAVGGVVLLVIGGLLLIGLLDNGAGLPALLVIGGLAYLVARERRDNPASRPSRVATEPPLSGMPYGPPSDWPASSVTERRSRERSMLGALTVSIAAVVAGVLLALRLAGIDELTAPRILAAALLVVGAGLVLGTWFGRARWLIAVGLVLALGLGASAAAQELDVDASVGERTWTPVASQDFALGAGEATLDLTGLEPGQQADISARIGAGALIVLVPDDVSVRVDSRVDLGQILRENDTLDEGERLREQFRLGDGRTTVELDLRVRMGEIEVRRVAS